MKTQKILGFLAIVAFGIAVYFGVAAFNVVTTGDVDMKIQSFHQLSFIVLSVLFSFFSLILFVAYRIFRSRNLKSLGAKD